MPSPHDALFRAVFAKPENAAGQLRAVLPHDIAARLDWTALRLEDGHYVDEALAARQSDLLFSARFDGTPILLYLLFEHQSTSDPMMPFRLLRYMVRVWDRWLAQHEGARTMPAILPVVLAHAEGGWRAPTSMDELLELPRDAARAVAPYVPRFRFVLDDLASRSDQELMGRALHALGVLGLLFLRHGRQADDLPELMTEWATLFRAVWSAPDGGQALGAIIRYAVLVNQAATIQDLRRVLVPMLGPGAEVVIMTEGQRLIQQGRAEGEAKGRAEGEAKGRAEGEAVGRVSALFVVFAARELPVSTHQRERILACQDTATLDRWLQRAATAASVDDALDERG